MPTPLYWLSYRHGTVFLQRAHSPIAALVKASLAGMDEEAFIEGHRLPPDETKKIPRTMISRKLSGAEAAALLKKLEEL
jgi:hypothetical protein